MEKYGGKGIIMKARFIRILCAAFAALLVLSGCEAAPTGEYADQIRAARAVSVRNSDTKKPIAQFYEEYGDDKIPALVLKFDHVNKVDEVCAKIKEKFKGLDIPYLVTNFEDLVFEAVKDNEFKSLGIVIQNDKSGKVTGFDYAPPLASINNLTRLKIHKLDEYQIKKIDRLDSVRELVTDEKLTLLDHCPNIEKLTIPGLSDPSVLYNIPTLKEVTTDETPYGKATLYAFIRENPQINAKDPEKPADKKELAQYNHAVQLYDISRIDTSGFTEIPWEDAKLHGKIAVAGYGAAIDAGGFDDPGSFVSADLCAALTDSPTERDAVIRITSESDRVGSYTGGGSAYDLRIYAEVIDLTNKTITKRHSIVYSGPSAVIVNGKGSTSGRFSLANTWEKVQEIFDTAYEK